MCKLLKKNKKFKATDGYQYKDLLKYAIDHLASAKVLFEKNPRCYDSAGYIAHLGLELILKSILLNKNGEFPADHNLKTLYGLTKKFGVVLEKDKEEILRNLNQFFFLRYSNPQKPIEIGDDDWKAIEQLFHDLLDKFPNNTISKLYNSNCYKKGGRILMMKPKKSNKPV